MMDRIDDRTILADTRRPAPKPLASRAQPANSQADGFAAVSAGLGSTRATFYGSSGRTPNNRADQTRRDRRLIGGPGNRHLTQVDLWVEREISRHIEAQSELFEGIIETWAAEVIQAGFFMKPQTGDAELDSVVKEALFGWDDDEGWFAECDASDRMHFWELLALDECTEVRDGDDALFLDPEDRDGRGSVAIIEGDRILSPSGYVPRPGTIMMNGIEMDDRTGRALRVFIADQAPESPFIQEELGQWFNTYDRSKPGDGGVLLSVRPKRYTATRRQPWLSTAVRAHDELTDVMVAMRILMRNAACRATYTQVDKWEDYKDYLQLIGFAAPEAENLLSASPNPGDHTNLNPGQKMGVLETNLPGSNFDPFIKTNIRLSGLPLGMGPEETAKIFDRNFSASRLSMQGSRRRYRTRQKRVKRRKVKPVVNFAIACLQAVGELRSRSSTINRIGCRFPTWPFIEPAKDAAANRTLNRMGVKHQRTIAEEIGLDYDAEQELFAEDSIHADTTASDTTPPASGADE